MSKILKRKYIKERKAFKIELYQLMKDDLMMAMLFQQIFINYTQRRLLHEVWYRLGTKHYDIYKNEFCGENGLTGKMMCGRFDEAFFNLYFINQPLYEKYVRLIPERYALGDALSVAYKVIAEFSRKEKQKEQEK